MEQVHIGGEPLYETEYSDQLLITLLKARNPARFKDRTEVSKVWDGDLTKLTEEQLEKAMKKLAAIA